MSRFVLHTKEKEKELFRYAALGLVCLLIAVAAGYLIHSIGSARAKSRETVLIYTEEEFGQYLVEKESEEYNLNGRYRLEADLDLSWLESSIGTNIEPFTGEFDGNGHVISGLERPLFGVLERAQVENLLLSEAVIVHPHTYYDGERYVDGYGALASYAIQTTVENCAMTGEIITSVPVETEYQMAKASPSDADEPMGPGMVEGPAGEIPEESGQTETEAGSGVETGGGLEAGQENGTADSSEGAGNVTGGAGENMTDGAGENGNAGTGETGTEAGPGTGVGSESASADNGEPGADSLPEAEETAESIDDTENNGTAGTENSSEPAGEPGAETGSENSGETGTEVDNESGTGTENSDHAEGEILPSETVGYRMTDRCLLTLKVPAVMDTDMAQILTATPSDATPPDTETSAAIFESAINNNIPATERDRTTEEPIEYIGNPDGDIYILVTAESVAVGGLIAQTSGETLITNSFTLASIGSTLDPIETFAGGLAGILGEGARVENSYASGLVDCDGTAAGFAAVNDGVIQNSYSTVSIGTTAANRSAFTAFGTGALTGCAYDRQMACMDNLNEQAKEGTGEDTGESALTLFAASPSTAAEWNLEALDTTDMTGPESTIPGDWYTAGHAYPQIPYFAANGHVTISSSSKASAVALMLPEGSTLFDLLEDSEIALPSDIDGEQIQWDASGDVIIDDNNQMRIGPGATISQNAIPTVGMALASPSEADQPDTLPEPVEDPQSSSEAGETDGIKLKATVGNISRNFSLMASRAADPADTTWEQIAIKWSEAGNTLQGGDGTKASPYLIGSAEELALFAYRVNQGENSLCAKLTANIDLFGTTHTDITYDAAADNLDDALRWIPIGENTANYYTGTFDGDGKYIEYLVITNDTAYQGLFGILGSLNTDIAVVKNVGVESGKVIAPTAGNISAVVGCVSGTGIQVSSCWNKAYIEGRGHTGGVVGGFVSGSNLLVEKCWNQGEVKSAGYDVGGVMGKSTMDVRNLMLRNCYNLGPVTAGSYCGGVIGTSGGKDVIENCYNVGVITGGKKTASVIGNPYATTARNNYSLQGLISDSVTSTRVLTEAQFQTWAAAYALNGQSMSGAWQHVDGKFPVIGTLDRPSDWSVIAQGVNDRLITKGELSSGLGSQSYPYSIRSAEQLAVFAAKVNSGNPEDPALGTAICAFLTEDIDLTGASYNGTADNPIPWAPIGTGAEISVNGTSSVNSYQGTFEGNGKIISHMSVEQEGYGGLFGCAGGGAVIRRLGLDETCSVKTIASSSGTAGDGTAAFVGALKSVNGAEPQLVIEHCYTRASISGKSGRTGAFLGSDDGTSGTGAQRITNCYTAGLITTANGEKPGAIAGSFAGGVGPTGGIRYCYWDANTSSASGVTLNAVGRGNAVTANTSSKTTLEMKNDAILDSLNAGASQTVWERSDSKNDGYPSFQEIQVFADWGSVGAWALEPDCASATSKGSASNPYLIRSPEDLAWFAYQVNANGKTGLCGKLMGDISLFGGLYVGSSAYDSNDYEIMAKALQWVPIGSDTDGKRYEGIFDGNGFTIYKMRAAGAEKQGLFGTIGGSTSGTRTVITNTGISTSLLQVTGQYAGGIAGYVNGNNVTISLCQNTGSLSGSGAYYGGIIGGADAVENLVIDGCGNSAAGNISNGSYEYVGGVLGGFEDVTTAATIRNCYNLGKVAGKANVGGITGSATQAAQKITASYNAGTVSGTGAAGITGAGTQENVTDCYYETGKTADTYATGLAQNKLKTWGAAWSLNGRKVTQATGISWDCTGDYPYPTTSPLGAKNWEVVANGIVDGFVDMEPLTSGSYTIKTAEQLAWFARQINTGAIAAGTGAVLAANIDLSGNAAGSSYVISGKLPWVPIGATVARAYTGTFGADTSAGAGTTYEISGLYIPSASYAGLFGIVSGGKLSGIGVKQAQITGADPDTSGTEISCAGGIAARLQNGASVTRCYNRGGSQVSARGASGALAGGIAGQLAGNSTVKDCYDMEAVVTASGTTVGTTGVYAGGIAGDASAGGIQNCYYASNTVGQVSYIGSGKAGSIAGQPGAAGSIVRCYSDLSLSDSAQVGALGTGDDTARQKQVDDLNTVTASSVDTERKRSDRVWFTSLQTEETKGLPTFAAPVMLEVTLNPADSESGRTVALGQTISGAAYRGVHQEHGSSQTFTLTGTSVVAGNYRKYGETNANACLGILAGSKDLKTLTPSLLQPNASAGDVSQLTFYNGAAYTCPDTRAILIDFVSGGVRYEVRAELAGVTEKVLSVVLPTSVHINISPDGTKKTSHSTDIQLVNKNDYPVEGSIRNLEPMTGAGYVTLQPIKPGLDVTAKKGQITKTGVKLGIDNLKSGTTSGTALTPSIVYYTPADSAAGTEDSWMHYRLKSNGTLWYQYFMEYAADHYYMDDLANYGYNVTYQFSIAKEDYTADIQAEIIP